MKKIVPFFFIDILCQGQVAETVIPLENGRKFVVCLDNAKGVEQECPRGLFYHTATRRCERSKSSNEIVFWDMIELISM